MSSAPAFTKEFKSFSALAGVEAPAESPLKFRPSDGYAHYFFTHLDEFASDDDFCDQFKANWAEIEAADYSSKQLTNILQKAAKFSRDYRGKGQLIAHIRDHADNWETPAIKSIKNGNFNTIDLSFSMHAHAVLGICPSDEFIRTWEESAIEALQTGEFSPKHLSLSLYAHAVLGIRPSNEFMKAWGESATKAIGLENFNEQDLSNSLYALGIIDTLGPPSDIPLRIATQIHGRVEELIENNNFTPGHGNRNQIAQACLWFDLDSLIYADPETHTVSRHEFQFLGHVNNALTGDFARVDPHKTKIYEALGHEVDGTYEKDNHRYYVEVDGPAHFVRGRNKSGQNTLRYNGSTLFQTALIHKLAPDATLLRVPYSVSDKIMHMPRQDMRQTIRQIFSNAVHKAGQGIDTMMMGPHRTKADRLAARRFYPDEGMPRILEPMIAA